MTAAAPPPDGTPPGVAPDGSFVMAACPGPDGVRVSVGGELDVHQESRLQALVDGLLERGAAARIVVDLTAVRFLDSSGLRSLLLCRDRARAGGTELALVVADGPVTRLLDIAGVRDWFDYEPVPGGR